MPRLFTSPSFPDPQRTVLARQVWFLAWGCICAVAIHQAAELLVAPECWRRGTAIFVGASGFGALILWLTHRGPALVAARMLVGGLLLTAGLLAWTGGGLRAPATLAFLPLVFLACLLLGFRASLFTGLAAGGWSILLALAEQTGQLPLPVAPQRPETLAIVLLLGLGLVTIALYLGNREMLRARAEAESAGAARRRSEAALTESEQRLALALEAATDGIYDVDLLTGEAYCSPRYYTMLGYAPGEFAPSLAVWDQMLHPDDRATAAEAMARYHDSRTETHAIEIRMRSKGGAWCWVLSRGRIAARDPAGRALRLIGTHVDIDARKQAELALHSAKEFAENLIAKANALIVGLDTDGRIILFNAAAEAATGYTHAELAGRNWFEVLTPRDRYPKVWAEFARLQSGGIAEYSENPILTKSGEERHIVWRNNVMREPGHGIGTISFGIDVTERRRAEQALAKERDLVARLVETSPSGIIVVDAAGQVSFANAEAERILSLQRPADDSRRYAPPAWLTLDATGQSIPEQERTFRQVVATGRPIHGARHLLQWPDGRRLLLSINAAPLFDSAGRIEGVVATFDDITERQRSEEAIHENEERLRSIVDHAPFGAHLYELQPDGRLLLQAANTSADEILHLDHRPLLGRELLEAFPGLRGTDIPETYRQVVTTGQSYHRAQFVYSAGTISGAFDVHALPIGRQRVVVFFVDVTERQRAEIALRRSEERFRLLFNSGNDSVFVYSVSTAGAPGMITQVNDVACQLLGYSREELLARGPHEISSPESLARLPAVFAQLRTCRNALFEAELLTKDGRHVPVEINARVFELEGQPTVLSVVRDISERRRLEDQLRQAQKMEVFGQLAGGVAHDFNNLLVAIIGNAELILDGPSLAGHPREQLEQIHEAGQRAAALTRQLLLFSRKQQPQLGLCDLGAVVTNHVKLLRRIIGEDINLTVELAPGPLPVLADVNMIEQVAMNLVVNARDAMPRGGTLTLGTRRAVLDATAAARAACPPGTYAGLLVHDTGTGIPPEIRQRIFEPFFTTKASGKGTGLGLSTVLGIVQQHHGGIELESEPGQGTRFTIYLPFAAIDLDATATEAPHPSDPVATPATILVVEDDDSVRMIVDHTLRLHHYHVATVRSAAEGLARLAQPGPPINLVLSDVVMPGGISGAQLAEEVAGRWPGLPVILMSGFARELEQTERRILQKPFSIAQLLSFVQEGLAQRRPPPQ